ncbi:ATPase [Massilia sp. CF038]|uniref:ATPase n=1 Tax=Massilia sp. CF038 TaxID=1881045 RepID=UPI00091825D0|nr:ATPase [Massilia sp. CF038]SHH40884.1 hypothetical protein SAMN05428948_3880 [Massilia sp. CF038]
MIEAQSSAEENGQDDMIRMPPQPKTVRETGLELALIVELVTKVMYVCGKLHLPVLTGKLRLSINVLREVLGFMLTEQLVEVAARGDSDLDVSYQLTHTGKLRASDFMNRCRYLGPAPVTLQAYCDLIARQSSRHASMDRVSAASVAAAFGEDSLDPAVRDMVGAAMQSSRSMLLYGPSGSGKSMIARKLGKLQQGIVAVPCAVLAGNEIVLVHDPLVHLAPAAQARQAEDRRSCDTRWMLCQRPLIQVGAEFCADMLDLRHDAAGGVYHAPPHLMANNGMLVIDDLGRQRMPSADLLNRFSAPLDTHTDHLTLHGGCKLGVPFDVTLVFATNLPPQLLLDDASMRRIAYKIHVGALSEPHYRALFRRQCRVNGLGCDDAVVEHLLNDLHAASGRALLASTPRELLDRLADFARFAGIEPRLTVPALDQAWSSLFAGSRSGTPVPSQPTVPFLADCGDSLLERIS